MNYLERVIKETMRLYTVTPIIARNVDRDIYLRELTQYINIHSFILFYSLDNYTLPLY